MIIALTMNPSVDISYPIEKLNINSVNRIDNVTKTAGGKGINVARVVNIASHNVIATGFLGGYLGEYIRNELDKETIKHQFLTITQESRNCIAMLHDGKQTEILESGPVISNIEQDEFKKAFLTLIEDADVITMSGSLPKGIPDNYYATLITLAHNQHKKVLLDCSGNTLKQTLSQSIKPYLIKPNHEELSFIIGKKIAPTDIHLIADILLNAPELNNIPMIIVTLGKEGAIARINQEIWRVTIPIVNVINPVGSGDATLAGLAIGVCNNDPIDTLLKRAMTFGILNALETKTGTIDLTQYDSIFAQVEILPISVS